MPDNHEITPQELEKHRQTRAAQVNLVQRNPVVARPLSQIDWNRVIAASPDPAPPDPADLAYEVAQAAARAERRKAAVIARIESRWNAPARQLKLTNPDRSGPWGAMELRLRQKVGSGFLVCLVGVRGCGKTQLAVELMKFNSRERLKASRYCSAMEFFLAIKGCYSGRKTSEENVLADFRSFPFLVIDEAGRRGETEWEDRMLFELLDKRYGDMTDTLLISNQSIDEFSRVLGASLSSRMNETGGVIECGWEPFRK